MTTKHLFSFKAVHSSWKNHLKKALALMDPAYLEKLYRNSDWLPGPEKIFNAFSLPLQKTNYILFGESPYPREASANGYAFWDAAVKDLWSLTGLSKQVNRATSLRNLIKMLLVAAKKLSSEDTSQAAMAKINKHDLITTNSELFSNFLNNGFLLLNTTLVLRPNSVSQDARAWQPFMQHLLKVAWEHSPTIELILLGGIANTIIHWLKKNNLHFKQLIAEHPYNISFISNPQVIAFFKPLALLHNT